MWPPYPPSTITCDYIVLHFIHIFYSCFVHLVILVPSRDFPFDIIHLFVAQNFTCGITQSGNELKLDAPPVPTE